MSVEPLEGPPQRGAANLGRHNVPGDAVIPDNVSGARRVGQALVELGHRRIGVISGPALLTTTRDRLDTLKQLC